MNYGPRIGESVVDPDPNRIRTAGTSIPDTGADPDPHK